VRVGSNSGKGAGGELYRKSLKPRRAGEWLSDRIYRPLAHRLVVWLYPTRVRPEVLVLFQGGLGVLAAGLILSGDDTAAAFLLLLRNVLDNADGQLARARGEATQLGRYLDTEVDLLTNLALFTALGLRTGSAMAAALGFALLTLLLSADYAANSSRDLPGARGPEPWARWLEAFYRLFFGPQDRFFGRLFARWLPPGFRRFLANLGLSTQHTALALSLLAGHPGAYLGAVFLAAGLALLVYFYGIWRTPSPPLPR